MHITPVPSIHVMDLRHVIHVVVMARTAPGVRVAMIAAVPAAATAGMNVGVEIFTRVVTIFSTGHHVYVGASKASAPSTRDRLRGKASE